MLYVVFDFSPVIVNDPLLAFPVHIDTKLPLFSEYFIWLQFCDVLQFIFIVVAVLSATDILGVDVKPLFICGRYAVPPHHPLLYVVSIEPSTYTEQFPLPSAYTFMSFDTNV